MSDELLQLYRDVEGRPARFRTPFKTIFFCGGEKREVGEAGPAKSLRDYICISRAIRVKGKIVFAEAANQLYRDTSYGDLISFEEDIARVASLVLVISESPGSLAELGAFATNDTIRQSLRVISQSDYEESESFIRFGPIEKLMNDSEDYVAFYPWRKNASGKLITSSARPHYSNIKSFIISNLDAAPSSLGFAQEPELKKFFVVYWALYLSYASSINVLLSAVRKIYPDMVLGEIKNILYCLRVVGWVGRHKYSNKEYWFALGSDDPLVYRFAVGLADRDMLARRLRVRREFERDERLPRHITDQVAREREGAR